MAARKACAGPAGTYRWSAPPAATVWGGRPSPPCLFALLWGVILGSVGPPFGQMQQPPTPRTAACRQGRIRLAQRPHAAASAQQPPIGINLHRTVQARCFHAVNALHPCTGKLHKKEQKHYVLVEYCALTRQRSPSWQIDNYASNRALTLMYKAYTAIFFRKTTCAPYRYIAPYRAESGCSPYLDALQPHRLPLRAGVLHRRARAVSKRPMV